MKICILSMQRVPNFGSLLQGYSLKKMLESQGHEVSFIDIQDNSEEDELISKYRKNYSFEYDKKINNRIFKGKIDKFFFNRIKGKIANIKQNRIMWDFQKKIINLNNAANNDHYDYCVIGSDEVFNVLNPSDWGFTSQLFGNITQADRVITYAASCGFTSYNELPKCAINIIRESFNNISQFSVRDNNTWEFVNSISGIDSNIHYDPVVVGDFEEEISRQELIRNLPSRYCVVYAYHDRINKPDEIKAIKKICKKEKMKIVSVGNSQSWIGKHLVVNPFQIPQVFSKAQFVVTDTFHGTIFAAKYSNKFAVIVRESNQNKLNDLIEKLEIQKHRVKSMFQLEKIYEENHNLEIMHAIEIREREKAINYLKESIR